MIRILLSPAAQSDLRSIWLYSARQWGRRQADVYIGDIRTALAKAAERSSPGRTCEDLRPGYYRLSCGSHIAFYRLVECGIDVVRILHQSMDFQRHI